MPQIGSIGRNLPVPMGAGSRFVPAAPPPGSAFIGQLIGRRVSALPRRRAPFLEALRTYDAGGQLRLLRLPPGYRLDIEA